MLRRRQPPQYQLGSRGVPASDYPREGAMACMLKELKLLGFGTNHVIFGFGFRSRGRVYARHRHYIVEDIARSGSCEDITTSGGCEDITTRSGICEHIISCLLTQLLRWRCLLQGSQLTVQQAGCIAVRLLITKLALASVLVEVSNFKLLRSMMTELADREVL